MSDSMNKVIDALSPLLNKMSPEEADEVRDTLRVFSKKLNDARVVGEAGAGLVKITTNGIGEPISVEIDDLIFKETDKQLVSDLFCAAIRDNQQKCQIKSREVEMDLQHKLLLSKLGKV